MNLVTRLHERAAEKGSVPALVAGERMVSFGELSRRVAAVAGRLVSMGFKAGDRVLVLHPVSIELYEFMLGAFHAGVVVVLADPGGGRGFIAGVCGRTAPRGFFGSRKAHLLRWGWKELRRIPYGLHPAGAWPGSRAVLGGSDPCPVFEGGADHPALITFTSGSTGLPKGAQRTHGFLLDQHAALERALKLEAGERDLVTLPVFALANLASGVTSVIADGDLARPGELDGRRIAAQCRRWKVTRATGSPAFFEALLRCGDWPGFGKVFTGGAPVFPDLVRRLRSAAPGLEVTAVYGSTEAEPIADFPGAAWDDEVLSDIAAGGGLPAGRPLLEVAILEDRFGEAAGDLDEAAFEARKVAAGKTGEIVVAGPQVLGGYLDGIGDQETKIRVAGRVWHRTGDAGRIDARGRLWLLGRCAARMSRGGEVVYPIAIEAALRLRFPGRKLAAVQGPDGPEMVIEGSVPDGFEEAARGVGCESVKSIAVLPMDRRHQAKVDYPALRKALEAD